MPLSTPLSTLIKIDTGHRAGLARLGINTVRDLLYHFPIRYGDTAEIRPITTLSKGEQVVIFGTVSKAKISKGFRTKIAMAQASITDESGSIEAVWFNQPYFAKMYPDGTPVRLEGVVSQRKKTGALYLSNPRIEYARTVPLGVGQSLFGESGESHSLYPVYPETKGVSSLWLTHAIQKVLSLGVLEHSEDPIPLEIREKYNLPSLSTACIWIHAPHKRADADSARKRFAFEEIFFIQIQKQLDRKEFARKPGFHIKNSRERISEFTSRFPFTLTDSQQDALNSILTDIESGKPMSRLLEGDVGSGKTAVAASVAYAVSTTVANLRDRTPLQVAYMAPTEILATQHFESFIQYFKHLPIQIGLLTGSGCRKFPSKVNPNSSTEISRTQLLKWVASGEITILIGTHALIQKKVVFKHCALAIIDEQHRFGVRQRQALVQKDTTAPHLLSMTATPIPRTLALTLFGDLDLSVIEHMPAGRKPIVTEIILKADRERMYTHVRSELQNGRQLYVICPRISDPDPDTETQINTRSVVSEAARLKKDVFPGKRIGILHSKMTPVEKEKVMLEFKAHSLDILVATSVVEVGVNVPNATVIIIEGADRFGLSQLHQLRGRVIRGTHQAYCYILTESSSEKTRERLHSLVTAKNGFELAELDLADRGAGSLSGGKQWGVSDLAMIALQNIKMVEFARHEARELVETSLPEVVASELERRSHLRQAHFE
jgi:ATP-dependent DNA helicase RecG